MSNPLNPIVPLAQMGHVEKLADTLQNQPAASQAVFQQVANEAIKQEQSQVEASNESARGKKIKREEKKEKGNPEQNRQFTKNTNQEQPAEQEEQATNPWSGNLLNVKV